MAVVGFDFGTTNSLVSLVQGDRVIPFLDDQGMPIPSVVCYEGAKSIFGREARERLGKAGLGVHGNIVRSPKMELGKEAIFVGGVERNPVDVVRDVIAYIRQQAIASGIVRGLIVDKATVTIPVNMDGRRRALLRDAFRAAGIAIVQFVHEPLAALYAFMRTSSDFEEKLRQYDRKLILVFDWGGGTLDLTLCRLIDGMLVQIVNDGTDEVGGDVFDETLRNELESRVRKLRALEDTVQVQPDARLRLIHRCEQAKIDLSTRERAQLFVGNFYSRGIDVDLDYALTRQELEEIFSGLLDKGLARIGRLLSQNGYTPASVSLCLVTGGMANMPAIQSRLNELFGPGRVHISERSATLISEGAAWIAHDDAPIYLAKNIELLLARNSYMPVIKAGVELPKEGQVRKENIGLYCADPRDGLAKFQLVSPIRPGPKVDANDPRVPLDNLVIRVDQKSRPLFERLELDLEIDDNLILNAKARSLIKGDIAEAKIHNLEFAVGLPVKRQGWLADDTKFEVSASSEKGGGGGVVCRSNIADGQYDCLIPGELYYEVNPFAFDTRLHICSQVQEDEKLYYAPCAICGRVSNDPLCRCATSGSELRA